MNKTITTIIAVIALLVGVVLGHSFWGKSAVGGATSPVGSTFSSGQLAMGTFGASVAPAGAGTVVYSALNTTASDRIITSVDGYFSTLISPAIQLYVATSTSATATSSTEYIENFPLGTGGGAYYLSTTTPSGVNKNGDTERVWPAGTYLDVIFSTSTSATSTGVIGVKFLPQ